MASSSSSSSPWINCPHDVFLSFRGKDVRVKFRSHFLKELDRKLITFKDDEIEKGRSIAPELFAAIRGSRISIVAFSENFASSSWCLDELVEIMKCRDELGQIVIPIFYEVDPSHVKRQSDGFGKIFEETCGGRTEAERLLWKKTLTDAANLIGEESRKWYNEAKMIEQIVNDVSNKLNSSASNDFDDFVGIGDHVKNMSSLLKLESEEVMMVGIWGPSGVGKTTIGRALFSQLSCQFVRSIFIDKTKEHYTRTNSGDYNTMLHLQTQFLSEILDQKDIKINGLGAVEKWLGHKKVLVVFDDVDDHVLLNALVGKTTWFGPSSRIIVISNNRGLLKDRGIEPDRIYEVAIPSKELAFQMFCRCAFSQDSPPDGFMEIATEAARLTEDLPLCLNVLGSSLAGMKKEEWADRVPKLRNSMAGQIGKTLRDSYDRLKEEDKAIFRHIACLFNHKPRGYVVRLLEDSKLDVDVGLVTLADRCLIQISEDKIIRMHDFLQTMGREIVRQPCIQRPGEREFLMDSKEIYDVLVDETGTESVLGIFLNLSEIEDTFSISKKAFRRMKNLQFLSLSGVLREDTKVMLHLQGGKDHMWRQLRLLEWPGCSMSFMPPNIRLENLVELRMPDSHLDKLWDGVQVLKSLKKMDLRRSKKLKEIPDLSKATNLEELYLADCWSLVMVPSSIRNLNRLRKLDMKRCKNLQGCSTTHTINLESLHSLNFSGCSQLKSFPQISTNISYLFLDETEIQEVPGWIECFSGLNYILMKGCGNLKFISPNISKLQHLEVIFFSNSDSLFGASSDDSPSAAAMTTDNIHTQLPDPSSSRSCKNDVFLSFYGRDVRRGLLSHMYKEFRMRGITIYKDDEIERTQNVSLELVHASRESRIAVVVLSKSYASSKWCLQELVEIIKCSEETGQKVIPIYHGVDPVHITKQIVDLGKTDKWSVSKIFSCLSKIFKKTCDNQTVDMQQKWVQALTVVNQLQGYHFRGGSSEVQMIGKIADDISLALNITPKEFSHVVGAEMPLRIHKKTFTLSCDDSSSAAATTTDNIHTQLPDVASSRSWKNDVFLSFRGSDVLRGLVSHMNKIFRMRGVTVFNDNEILRSQDVDLDPLCTIRESRIAIVVLSKNYASSSWCLKELVEIIKCGKETGQKVIPFFYGVDTFHIKNQILDLGRNFLTVDMQQECVQAFTVLTQLQGYDSRDWSSEVEMIEKIADDISFALNVTPKDFSHVVGTEMQYDGLNMKEKALFRHIACFLNNETYANVMRLLEESELDVGASLKILFDKCLIQISGERVISMDHSLQKLGREIVLGPFIHQPAKRQFLMDTSDGCDVLIDQTGIENVFGISFNVSEMKETSRSDERFKGMKKLQFMRVYKEILYGKEVRFHLVKGLNSMRHRLNLT